MVSLSQSGASPDIVRTLEAARAGGAITAAIVNQPDSPLARAALHPLPQHAGPERSVAATKSVIATLAACARLVATWRQDRAAAGGAGPAARPAGEPRSCDWSAGPAAARAGASLYVVGRGPGLGIAAETALKLKETSGVLAEALSAAEIQHGPKAVIGPGFPVLAYGLADPGGEDARSFAADLAAVGAQVMVASAIPAEGAASICRCRRRCTRCSTRSWRCWPSTRWPRRWPDGAGAIRTGRPACSR